MSKKEIPLILVFYIDTEMMQNPRMIQPFVESVNHMIEKKNANIMAFFVPTKGEDRIECLNPTTLEKPELAKINQMVEDIKNSFSIGVDISLPDEEIITDSPCKCGGNCTCK